MRPLLPVLACALTSAILTACGPRPAQFTVADEAAVRAVFDSVVAQVNAKNWDAWAAGFTDSAVFHPSNGKALHGRPAILAWVKTFPPIEEFSFSDVRVWGEGDLAYGTSAVFIKIQGAPADTSKQLAVFRRSSGGRWEVAAVSVTSDLPAVAPPAAPQPPARRR